MSGSYMRRLMEAIEGDQRLQAFKQKVEQKAQEYNDQGKSHHFIENYILPDLSAVIQYGEPNPGNILVNPWNPRSQTVLGEPDDYIIKGNPERVLNILGDRARGATMMKEIPEIVGEEIDWTDLYIIFHLVSEDPFGNTFIDIKKQPWLLIGEGTDEIDEIRVYKNEKTGQYPVFFVNGNYVSTENKLRKLFRD